MEASTIGTLLFDAALCVERVVLPPSTDSLLRDLKKCSVTEVEEQLGLRTLSADARWVRAEGGTVERTVGGNGPVQTVRLMPRKAGEGIEAAFAGPPPAAQAASAAATVSPPSPQCLVDAHREALMETLRAHTDPFALQQAAVQVLKNRLDADWAHYEPLDAADGHAGVHDACTQDVGASLVAAYAAPNDDPDRRRALRAAETIVVEDPPAQQDPEAAGRDAAGGVSAWVGVPICPEKEPTAMFVVARTRPRARTSAAVTLVEAAAHRVHAAVQRARAERSLRNTTARLDAFLAATSEVTYRMSPDWSTVNVVGGKDVFSDARTLPETWLTQYIPPDVQPRVTEAIATAIANEQMFELEHPIEDSNGTRRWVHSRAVPVLGDDGEIMEWFGAARDVTERRETEAALHELNETLEVKAEQRARELTHSEQEFTALVNASAAMVWRTDAQGEVTKDSPSWRAYTGQSREDLEEGRWLEVVHPDDRDMTVALWRQSVEQEVLMLNELRLYHAESDTHRWVRARAVPLRHEDGSVRGWLGMNLDIHNRRRVEEQLRSLTEDLEQRVRERTNQVRELSSRLTMAEQRERKRLAEVLHDDLQQRLYGINLQLSTLRKQVKRGNWDALLEHVDTAEAWMKDAIRTTRQLSVDLSPPVLSTEGLPEALAWLRTQMQELYDLDVQVRTDLQGAPGLAEDMRVLLFQSVRELLFNVVKHAGVLRATVHIADRDAGLSIVVADDGQGFAPDAELVSSAGFGLTSVQKRIGLFGGDVSVSSAPGAGTEVHIQVPSALLRQSMDLSDNTA